MCQQEKMHSDVNAPPMKCQPLDITNAEEKKETHMYVYRKKQHAERQITM